MDKLLKNPKNLFPVIINVLWCLFVVLQFFTTVPNLDQNNRYDGSGMFIIGLLLLSSIVFLISLIWIIISNIMCKVKFYLDIQYCFIIFLVLLVALCFR